MAEFARNVMTLGQLRKALDDTDLVDTTLVSFGGAEGMEVSVLKRPGHAAELVFDETDTVQDAQLDAQAAAEDEAQEPDEDQYVPCACNDGFSQRDPRCSNCDGTGRVKLEPV